MDRPWLAALGGIGVLVVGVGSVSAAGAGEPLLVGVEAQPGSRVDAGEVRQRIAAELGRSVISPRDLAAAGVSNVLIVALDADSIRVSLREGTKARISRVIPDAAESSARLREIAWLAGNLARDQVSPILPRLTGNADCAGGRARRAGPGESRRDRTAAAAGGTRATGSHCCGARRSTGRRHDARWAITVAGGRTADGFCLRTTCGGGPWVSFDNGYQIELQHQHIEPTGLEAGLESDFASAMVGIRLRLP